jgi:hypothetical protein
MEESVAHYADLSQTISGSRVRQDPIYSSNRKYILQRRLGHDATIVYSSEVTMNGLFELAGERPVLFGIKRPRKDCSRVVQPAPTTMEREEKALSLWMPA